MLLIDDMMIIYYLCPLVAGGFVTLRNFAINLLFCKVSVTSHVRFVLDVRNSKEFLTDERKNDPPSRIKNEMRVVVSLYQIIKYMYSQVYNIIFNQKYTPSLLP